MSDGKVLEEASAQVRDWKAQQTHVKEESLTDWLLYAISRNSARITYREFNRHEEARKTGADWEWWILLARGAFRLRVQAKNTWPNADHYAGLAHTNRYGLQIEKLRKDAQGANALAFYAFYTAKPPTTEGASGKLDEGVYLASAKRIYDTFVKNGVGRVNESDIFDISVPLSCLFRCPVSSGGTIYEFLSCYFSEEFVYDVGGSEVATNGFHERLPGYVRSLVELGLNEVKTPDSWGQEFQDDIVEFNRILIIDARPETKWA